MHHALQIQEILRIIFAYCRLPTEQNTFSDLPALARTCRAFKEPALDMLWEELFDPSPLARCLPEASHRSQILPHPREYYCYSFSRSLTQAEWSTLRSYTRRIRFMRDSLRSGLDWESLNIFLSPSPTEPLFPHLRCLCACRLTHIEHLLRMPFPSLTSLTVGFLDKEILCVLQGFLEPLSKLSPTIKGLSIGFLGRPDINLNDYFSAYICRWQDLESVDCGSISLDVSALVHLSHMPALARLKCTLNATFTVPNTFFSFPSLRELKLHSEFLHPISQLLLRTRLPAITDLTAVVDRCPSRRDVSSFFSLVQTSSTSSTIQRLKFAQGYPDSDVRQRHRPVIGLEDLQPCAAFYDLRRIEVNIGCNVDLADSELLVLASGWPRLEHLLINREWGWNTQGGITPDGLVQLLQTCQSLGSISLAIDTRGYTKCHLSPASLGFALPSTFSINVLDSTIDAESVSAISAFFVGIAPRPNFSFFCWLGSFVRRGTVYKDRWKDVYRRANTALIRVVEERDQKEPC